MAQGDATITLSQIAELAGVRPSAVSNWRKRFDDFPRPIESAARGSDLFRLSEVEDWLRKHGRFDPERTAERLLFAAADLLRDRAAADEAMALFAAAIALTEALERLGGARGESPDVAERVRRVERAEPMLSGVFAPLEALEPVTASRLLHIAEMLDADRRVDMFEWALRRRTRFVETRTSDELVTLLVEIADRPDARSVRCARVKERRP